MLSYKIGAVKSLGGLKISCKFRVGLAFFLGFSCGFSGGLVYSSDSLVIRFAVGSRRLAYFVLLCLNRLDLTMIDFFLGAGRVRVNGRKAYFLLII